MPRYVIEGVITNNGVCRVLLSTSNNFDEDNNFDAISGATVSITEDQGGAILLTERKPGNYQSAYLKGKTGHTYHLLVNIKGQQFTASSVMPPQAVKIDSVFFSTEILGGTNRRIANACYTDPPVKGNCYRFVQYINEHKESTVFVDNDKFNNGHTVAYPLYFRNNDDDARRNIISGDTVRIEMHCIDSTLYKYWYSLSSLTAAVWAAPATPSNPVTNITGGALGYFSAHTVRSIRVVVH
ncbi:hypothetical protein FLA_4042 [Filimonas lacunae]|nr:hypothetical protein FLA_4042 [Filimonas lacunae]